MIDVLIVISVVVAMVGMVGFMLYLGYHMLPASIKERFIYKGEWRNVEDKQKTV